MSTEGGRRRCDWRLGLTGAGEGVCFLNPAQPEGIFAVWAEDFVDDTQRGIFEADLFRPKNKQNAVRMVLFSRLPGEIFVHKVHFAVTGVVVPFALGCEFTRLAEPAIGVIAQSHEGNYVGHIERFGGAEYGVEIIEAGFEPVTSLDEVDAEIIVDQRLAGEFAVKVIKVWAVNANNRKGENRYCGRRKVSVLLP